MHIKGVPIPYGAPNANSYCERVIDTFRRECRDHFIFLSEHHLRKTVLRFQEYYNTARPHQGIGGIPAELEEPRGPLDADDAGELFGTPVHLDRALGGLHHDYRLAA